MKSPEESAERDPESIVPAPERNVVSDQTKLERSSQSMSKGNYKGCEQGLSGCPMEGVCLGVCGLDSGSQICRQQPERALKSKKAIPSSVSSERCAPGRWSAGETV